MSTWSCAVSVILNGSVEPPFTTVPRISYDGTTVLPSIVIETCEYRPG